MLIVVTIVIIIDKMKELLNYNINILRMSHNRKIKKNHKLKMNK